MWVREAVATVVALAMLAPSALAGQAGESPVRKRTAYEDLQMFSQILNQIRVNHPDSVESHALMMAAIKGMLNAADPHSYFITAYRMEPEREKAWRDGKLYPVPINFAFRQGAAVVISLAPGSAAAKSDIFPGDELVAIEGKPVVAESEFELDAGLAGAKNSTVRLTFERQRSDGSLASFERAVKRERVSEATAVPTTFMLDGTTGYTRITGFDNKNVSEDLHAALETLETSGMRKLVLDLRDNPGGIVEEAAKVAGEFLPRGSIVYTQEGRRSDIADTGRVGRSFWNKEKRYPIVVLINTGSASAAELVAGALQDHDRALIVGRPSFGKSLVMRGFPLTDGSVAVMVVGHIRTPCGRIIQRQYRGVTRRSYYRLARAERDTAGRPSCKTTSGRTVYGGGGVFPDVMLPNEEVAPAWMSRVAEQQLLLRWTASHVEGNAAHYSALDALAAKPVVAPGGLAAFRKFAAAQGVTIPEGADADMVLSRAILTRVADAKWGDAGYYRISAVLDPEVARATAAFEAAAGILR